MDKGRAMYTIQFAHNVMNSDFNNARMVAMHMFDGQEMLQYLMPIFEARHSASERQHLVDRFFANLDPLNQQHQRGRKDAILLAAMGVFDQATEVFVKYPGWRTQVWNKLLVEYRASDEFKDYVRQTKMEAYWRKHGWPDLCRPLGDADFECD
jgi:hypothetical protein